MIEMTYKEHVKNQLGVTDKELTKSGYCPSSFGLNDQCESGFGNCKKCWEQEITETVNHPSHYNREGAMECIDEMVLMFGKDATMTFCRLNAWKYRYRAADKNGEEDLKKSDWYLKKYKELKVGDVDATQQKGSNTQGTEAN